MTYYDENDAHGLIFGGRAEAIKRLEDLIYAAGRDGVEAATLLAESRLVGADYDELISTLLRGDRVVERVTRVGADSTTRRIWHREYWDAAGGATGSREQRGGQNG